MNLLPNYAQSQVLQRIDDVSLMCDKREASLKKHATRVQRPVQQVIPEPAVPLQPPGGAPPLFRMRPKTAQSTHQRHQHQHSVSTVPLMVWHNNSRLHFNPVRQSLGVCTIHLNYLTYVVRILARSVCIFFQHVHNCLVPQSNKKKNKSLRCITAYHRSCIFATYQRARCVCARHIAGLISQ